MTTPLHHSGTASPRRHRGMPALALTLMLAACSQPASPGTPSDPYAGGATHPWSATNTAPAAIPATVNTLSALDYAAATNGWGPLERDHSNGTEKAGDGGTLTIGGKTFSTGLGVHAPSTVTYALNGTCAAFSAQVGVDDEVGTRGSVVFEVYGDGVKLAASGTMTGGQTAQTLTAPLTGVKELKLVVTDAGDGIAYDHADWGGTTLDCTPPAAVNTFTFSGIAAQPQPVSEAQGEMVGGKLYVFGGFDSLKSCCTPTNRAQVYDPAANSWTALHVMPGTGVTHTGMATDGSRIYYAGGYVGKVSGSTWSGQVFGTTDAYSYDPAGDSYTRLPNLPVTLAAGQLEYISGKLHYFGGTNSARTQDLGTHYVLDLAAKATAWTVAAAMPHPRHHMGSVVLNGRIYAIGGQIHHDMALVTQPYVEVYDPATDRWTEVAPLPRARSHIANSTFVLAGRIVVAGGETSHDVPMADVTAYDPTTNRWTELTPLPEARASSVAGALGTGYLYTGGNSTASGWKATPKP